MAEGAAAAAAPSGGPAAKGSSSSSSGAWWKSLTAKKKPKEDSGPAWLPAEAPEMLPAPPRPSDSQDSQPLASGGGSSSRRNLKISRSGRFKEKRKVRATLLAESPQKLFEGGAGGAAGSTSPAPAHPSPDTPPGP